MTEHAPGPHNNATNHVRLNGWKEIAAHLGKSVRTVQRWERELRLPVHRIRTAGGEIVFAFRSELDKWQAEVGQSSAAQVEQNGWNAEHASVVREAAEVEGDEQAGESPSASLNGGAALRSTFAGTRKWIAAAALLVAAALLWAGWQSGVIARADQQPARCRVEDDTLKVFNSRNEKLWEHRFDFDLADLRYVEVDSTFRPQVLQIEDLDGDGRKEVLLNSYSPSDKHNSLYCFNSDGSLRFKVQPAKIMKFGGEEFPPPFLVRGFRVAADASARKSIWVQALHHLWFPSVIQKVSPTGEVLAEYWSNGHVNNFSEASLGGRQIMLVGAMDNESWTGTLAALDYENPAGSAPAATAKYRCENCPPGSPLAFLVFPRTELSRELNQRPAVHEIRAQPNGNFIVSVVQGTLSVSLDSVALSAGALYTLDNRLEVLAAEASDTYRRVHSTLELSGRLKHHYGPACEKQLLPVQLWNGTQFVNLRKTATARTSPAKTLAMAKR